VTVELRDARPSDETDFRRLWEGFCNGYGLSLLPEVTAFHQHHPSTWVMGDDGYLEDLFVAPEARGQGLGRALIEDLVAIGRAKGWQRLYWLTEIENATARRLYDQFCDNDGHIRYRMTL
jgi:GNAT superfamily N-acetyltransferase